MQRKMETRQRKRKAVEDMEHKLLQKRMTEYYFQRSSKTTRRDIVIDDKSLVKIVDPTFSQVVKIESEVKNEIESVPIEVKVEIKKEVIINEQEFICDNDQNQEYVDYQVHEFKEELLKTQSSSNVPNVVINEDLHLEKMLPRKVWKRIAETLKDHDCLNFINSAPYFRTLLPKQTCTFLFKPVFEVLVPNLAKHSDILMKTEAQPVLLQSRRVCKKWRNVVDATVSNWYTDFGHAIGQKSRSLKKWLDKTYDFEALTEAFDKFTVMFQFSHGLHGKNPFVGRYINISKRVQASGRLVKTNWDPCGVLFDKFGHNILTCQLNMFYTNPLEIQAQNELVGLLHKLPQLKNLRITYSEFGYYKEDADDCIDKQLVLPNMECLQTVNLVAASPSFCKEILNNSQNITCLIVHRSWCHKPNPKYFSRLKYLQKLESLQISVQSKQDLKYLQKLNSPLKTLNLTNAKYDVINWRKELEKISMFSKTLEVLRLINVVRLPCNKNFLNWSHNGRLDLPNLKIFHSEIANFLCLDFLLESRFSLEEISIKTSNVKWDAETKKLLLAIEKKQIVQFLGFENKLVESNIWRTFPKLKIVSLELNNIKTKHTREAWKRYINETVFFGN